MRKHRVTIALTLLAGLVGWSVGYFTRPEPEPDPLLEKASQIHIGMALEEVYAILGSGEHMEFYGAKLDVHLGLPGGPHPIEWLGTTCRVTVWARSDRVTLIECHSYTPPLQPSWWARVRGRLGL